jgi:hypothetical protein
MANKTRTFNFVPLGGGLVSIPLRYKGSRPQVERVPQANEDYERTSLGFIAARGPSHSDTYEFPMTGWLFTQAEIDVIMAGFVLCNQGRRLKDGKDQFQFLLEDEFEELEDSSPPERAYVSGTLRTINSGTTPTSMIKPIFYAVFVNKPTWKCVGDSSDGDLFEMNLILEEGDIYYAAEQLPSPTITATQVAPLAADSPIGTHFVTFS